MHRSKLINFVVPLCVVLLFTAVPNAGAADKFPLGPPLAPANSPYHRITAAELENLHEQRLAEDAYYVSWTEKPFSGSDPKYGTIRRLIDFQFASHVPASSILSDLQDKYSKNKNDPTALVALSYAGFKSESSIGSWGLSPATDDAFMLFDALSAKKITLPHTYETARIVFLCNTFWFHNIPLQHLGERLLQHDPNDPDVKFFTADALVYSDLAADRELGAKYVDEIAKAEPNDPRVYLLKEDQLEKLANMTHNIQDLKDCIADWQKYYATEPTGSPDAEYSDLRVQAYNHLIDTWSKGK